MKCNNIREELIAYIDGELSPMGRHAIEAHLDGCSECAAECKSLENAIEWTHQVECVEPSQDWWEKLKERMYTTEHESDLLAEIRQLRESVERMENRMEQNAQPAEIKEVMTLEEVSAYLQIDLESMWNLLDEIPHFQVGYEVRFKRTSVDEWIRMKETGDGSDLFHWDMSVNWLDRFSQIEW